MLTFAAASNATWKTPEPGYISATAWKELGQNVDRTKSNFMSQFYRRRE